MEENWRDKCERYVTRQISTTANNHNLPGETPRSARSIIPPTRNSGKYKINRRNPKPDDLYIRKAFTLSSIHGLPFVTFLTSRLGRITWSVIIIICLGCFLYLLVNYVQLYLEYGRHFETVSHENDRAEFPTVTLCNLNTLQRTKIGGSTFGTLLQLNDNIEYMPENTEQRKNMILNSLATLNQFMLRNGIDNPNSYIEENKPWLDMYSESSLEESDWISLIDLIERYDSWDLWSYFLQTSREEAQLYGSTPSELVVKCKHGRNKCAER